MNCLMGIDLGSTSLKAVVYDLDGNAVAMGSTPTERYNPNPDHPEWTVWMPEQIWHGAAQAIRQAVAQLDDSHCIRGVAVTGMGMDAVPMNEDGEWIGPFISWHDPRTEPQQRWWHEHIGAEKEFSIGGWPILRFNTALRLLWLAEHEPETLAHMDKFLLIEDFLNFMLCGRQATDYTMASCTLLFDQRKLDWSQELLQMSGIDRRHLCDPFPSGTVLGEVTQAASDLTGLPAGTPVVLGGHDFLCGALPVGAFKPGIVLDVTGTWEIVLTAVEQPVLSADILQMGLVMEAHVARDVYAAWGGAVASEMLEWYRKQYGSDAQQRADVKGGVDWDYLMDEASQSPPGSRGVTFLPHMSGSGCPVMDSRSLGAFVGLSNFAGRGDMVRAIIEGLDYQFRDIVNAMETSLGLKPEKIVAVGGAVRNRFWMQNKADVLGCVIEVPEIEEATPLGAAILAGIGVGLYRDTEDAFVRVQKASSFFEPNPAVSNEYVDLFGIYQDIYPNIKSVSHRIYDRFLGEG